MAIATSNSSRRTQPATKLCLAVMIHEVHPLVPTELDVHQDIGMFPSTLSAGTQPFKIGVSCAISLLVPAYHLPQKHRVLFGDPSDCMNRQIPLMMAEIELSALFCHGLLGSVSV
jgi:hypothetical protein